MKKIGVIVMSLFLITTTTPSFSSVNAVTSEVCLVCEHVCCCPEVCETKLKELHKKTLPNVSCDQSSSQCLLQSVPPLSVLDLKNEILWSNSQRATWTLVRHLNSSSEEKIFGNTSIVLFPISLDILTPPPRLPLS